MFGKKRGCFKVRNDELEEFQLAPEDVADKYKHSDGEY